MGKRHQKSREGQTVTPETVAKYTAARAFLFGEWFGAGLCVASFTLLYLFSFATDSVDAKVELVVCGLMLAVGAWAFWKNRTYYERLDFPWAKRWHTAAFVTAGAGAIFWLLFGLLVLLAALGIDVGAPE